MHRRALGLLVTPVEVILAICCRGTSTGVDVAVGSVKVDCPGSCDDQRGSKSSLLVFAVLHAGREFEGWLPKNTVLQIVLSTA